MRNPTRLVLIPLLILVVLIGGYYAFRSLAAGRDSYSPAGLAATDVTGEVPPPGQPQSDVASPAPVAGPDSATPTQAVPSLTVGLPAPDTASPTTPAGSPATPAPVGGAAPNPMISAAPAGPAPLAAVGPEPAAAASSAAPATQPSPDLTALQPTTPAAALLTPTPTAPPTRTYAVKSGDNLSTIARQYYGSASRWTIIARANPTVDPNRLKIGQKLTIPDAGSMSSMGALATGHENAATATDAPADGQTYKVQSGDTLWTIAQHFYHDGSKWPAIAKANRRVLGPNMNHLRSGITLVIPSAPAHSNMPAATATGEPNK